MGFVGNLPGFPALKEFLKSLRIDKVIAMTLVYYFFGTMYTVYRLYCALRAQSSANAKVKISTKNDQVLECRFPD